jgi:hypothetical protein
MCDAFNYLSDAGDTFQWHNNIDIPGATNANYVAAITGHYMVIVTI